MKTYTVIELTQYIKEMMENDRFLINLWVKGEISNYRPAVSGHLYFTLKDNISCIRSVMFKSRANKLLFKPENGMAVRIRGYISIYERDGSYQLYVEEMEPDGVGALYIAFEQLKEKLSQEGLFDVSKKKKIPWLPTCIGVVTSPTGAALRDILKIISRRWPGINIVIKPVTVQGEASPAEIADGIRDLNRNSQADVIIVGRGGGSLEELWSFNTEVVARSIASSDIPIISAVGHETDFTIADMVADLRAPTPSAAAELGIPVKIEVARAVKTLEMRMQKAISDNVIKNHLRLTNCQQNFVMRRPIENICDMRALSLDQLYRNLIKSTSESVSSHRGKFAELAGKINTLSPMATLSRGYSICISEKTGEILKDADSINKGDKIQVNLYKGSLKCEVL